MTEENHAREQAKAQLQNILKLVQALEKVKGVEDEEEKAIEAISENSLSVQVRSDWSDPGNAGGAEEYRITLCMGGPAVQITGDLNYYEPASVRLQYQDWGTPWTDYPLTGNEEAAVLKFTSHFYYGE